jgi:hypothetical protein
MLNAHSLKNQNAIRVNVLLWIKELGKMQFENFQPAQMSSFKPF